MRSVYRGARRCRGSPPFARAGGRAWFRSGAGWRRHIPDRSRAALLGAFQSGEVAQLRYRPNDPAAPGTPIFGPLAAWYVNDILAEAPAPPGVLAAEVRRGRRLALEDRHLLWRPCFWAVGYDRGVTIGCGRGAPTGTPMPGGSGRVTAAPIMFKIADLLGPSPP